MPDRQFWDTNLWVYLFVKSSDAADLQKRQTVKTMLSQQPDIYVSAQVLNEVANVLLQKYGFDEMQTTENLERIIKASTIEPLTESLSLHALQLKARYKMSWFDSLITGAALACQCQILYSEDMQDGQVIEGTLTVKNPFV